MTLLQFFLWSLLKVVVVTVVLLLWPSPTRFFLSASSLDAFRIDGGQAVLDPSGCCSLSSTERNHFSRKTSSPAGVYRPLYLLAPIIALSCALISIAVVPFGDPGVVGPGSFHFFQIADVNIGLLVILGITSIGVYGIALAGWSSNNKYSLLGSLRSSAQLVSYELALGLSLVGVVLRAGSLNLDVIVRSQATHGILSWNLFGGFQFVAFFIYLMAAYAETNRSPFDLPEAESELTAGYHTEYSSMKFAMFFMAEYANMIMVGCVATLLFLGGWTSPFGNLLRHARQLHPACADSDLLVRPEGLQLPVSLRVGPRNAAPFPLRPAHELRMALPDAARHPQHCGYEPLACVPLGVFAPRLLPQNSNQLARSCAMRSVTIGRDFETLTVCL